MAGLAQKSPWSQDAPVPNLADVTESDTREEYQDRLGTVLQLGRKAAKLNQEEVAARMGMAAATFTRWENGHNGISAYDLARLVRIYNLDPDLVMNPPASKLEVRHRLGLVGSRARKAVRRAQTDLLPEDGAAPS
jgi:transcriptional regulator with XRE-family HTH domain